MKSTPGDISLENHIDRLEEMLEFKSTDSIDSFRERLEQELIQTLYIGLGWKSPNGSWTPLYPWGDHERCAIVICKEKFKIFEDAKDLSKEMDRIFCPGRQYFSDDKYRKIHLMFRLFFILKKAKFISEDAMSILEGLFNEPGLHLNNLTAP